MDVMTMCATIRSLNSRVTSCNFIITIITNLENKTENRSIFLLTGHKNYHTTCVYNVSIFRDEVIKLM